MEAENNSCNEQKICAEDVEDFGRLFAGRKRDAMPANTAIATSWTSTATIAQKSAYPAVAECPHLAPMAQPMRSKTAEKMER